jgi:hypothetical protein
MAIINSNSGLGSSGFNPENALGKLSGQDIFSALNVPENLKTGVVDVSSVVPSLGDQTGVTGQAGIFAGADLYRLLQQNLSIINYLNTAPEGTQPNPNFAYIPGRPPYAQDTPEGQAQQAKVYAQLRTNIIARLVRNAEQLRSAYAGLRQQTDLAATFKKTQDGDVSKFVKDAFGGGGG